METIIDSCLSSVQINKESKYLSSIYYKRRNCSSTIQNKLFVFGGNDSVKYVEFNEMFDSDKIIIIII